MQHRVTTSREIIERLKQSAGASKPAILGIDDAGGAGKDAWCRACRECAGPTQRLSLQPRCKRPESFIFSLRGWTIVSTESIQVLGITRGPQSGRHDTASIGAYPHAWSRCSTTRSPVRPRVSFGIERR